MKILAPHTWGEEAADWMDRSMERVMAEKNPDALKEVRSRRAVDRALRARLEELGILQTIQQSKTPRIRKGEYTVRGAQPSPREERKAIAKINGVRLPKTVDLAKFIKKYDSSICPKCKKNSLKSGYSICWQSEKKKRSNKLCPKCKKNSLKSGYSICWPCKKKKL